ncbi:hypothetical protein ACVME8_010687 [Bradyrhizobium diazoefficiens]
MDHVGHKVAGFVHAVAPSQLEWPIVVRHQCAAQVAQSERPASVIARRAARVLDHALDVRTDHADSQLDDRGQVLLL